MAERAGVMHLTGWCGNVSHPVTIIGETPKRYRVRLHADMRLPGRRYGKAGDVLLVPKRAVECDSEGKR